MKLLVALNDNNRENSKLSAHFGHCPFFGIYEDGKLEIINNVLDHKNPNLTPVDQIMKLNIDMVFTLGIGKKAIELFEEKNVSVKTGKFTILKEVIDNIDSLNDFNGGCDHQH